MTREVISLTAEGDERAEATASCLRRLIAAGPGSAAESSGSVAAGLAQLASSGRLFLSETGGMRRLYYSPSVAAKRTLFEETQSAAWPPRLQKEMKQSTQSIPGALFHLPLADAEGEIDVFITDWSPFPAACAVAVHPQHPTAIELGDRSAAWTGRYARHPLTGDLLAIWVADWVRPEFGSGAVVVNPAHSAADLEFARSVGLPVRFGLAPQMPTTEPSTWPTPPVIKTGIAVRGGIVDGQDFLSARKAYLDLLVVAGHATEYTDHVLTPVPLADAASDRTVADIIEKGDPAPYPGSSDILSSAVEPGTVIVASMVLCAELITIRAMHIDLHGTDIIDPRVMLVGNTSAIPDGGDTAERRLALLAAAGVDQVATVKGPGLEQAQRFFQVHGSLPEPVIETDLVVNRPKRITTIFELIGAVQFDRAFAELYKVQRDIRKNPDSVSAADRKAYFAAAYVLADADVPADYPLEDVLAHFRQALPDSAKA